MSPTVKVKPRPREPLETIVLDAWAVLAWLQGEPAGRKVRDLVAWAEGDPKARERSLQAFGEQLKGSVESIRLMMNVINLGEVFYIVGRAAGGIQEAQDVVNEVQQAPIEIVSASNTLVFQAAAVKVHRPISYADAFAVATAQIQNAFLLTGDPELKEIEEVPILWIGKGFPNEGKEPKVS